MNRPLLTILLLIGILPLAGCLENSAGAHAANTSSVPTVTPTPTTNLTTNMSPPTIGDWINGTYLHVRVDVGNTSNGTATNFTFVYVNASDLQLWVHPEVGGMEYVTPFADGRSSLSLLSPHPWPFIRVSTARVTNDTLAGGAHAFETAPLDPAETVRFEWAQP